MTDTYCADPSGVWHGVKHVDDFSHRVRGLCLHDFEIKSPPVAKRPRIQAYCCGCRGAEEREAAQKKKASQASVVVAT